MYENKSLISVIVGILLTLTSGLAYADAGVPMIFVTFPSMVIVFIPIVIVEVLIFVWLLKIQFRH